MNQPLMTQKRLHDLRSIIAKHALDALLIPRADEWLGEFVAPYAERLKYVTGFTGSAGLLLLTPERAILFTDSRYTIQARQQLDAEQFEVVDSAAQQPEKWMRDNLQKGAIIGFDAWLHTDEFCQKAIGEGLELAALDTNPVDQIWPNQPPRPATTIHPFPEDIAGNTHTEKCNQIAWMMQKIGVRWYIITQPDSIAWLLNIRASDVEYIPQALSYLMVGENAELIWFVDPERLSDPVKDKLKDQASFVHPDNMAEFFTTLREAQTDVSFGIDFKRSPIWFKLHFAEMGKEVIDIKDPCLFPKSLKTRQEQQAIYEAHIIDGVAMVRFLAHVDRTKHEQVWSEMSLADYLEECRALSDRYCGPSFPAISGFGAHGAIVHYRASEGTDTEIEGDGLLLIDSGGQYHYGTTDITRTIAFGSPSKEMKENFTRVLRGMIAVSLAQFEDGTTGKDIDALARAPLQEVGLDYGHGTGHGVGCFLAVHEHAANLSPRGEESLKPGMLISNEPGYYKEGEYGIRIENLIICAHEGAADAQEMLEAGRGQVGRYVFETVTLVPIDLSLIIVDMLSEQERVWLNDYHAYVRETLSDHLSEDDQSWLAKSTKPI